MLSPGVEDTSGGLGMARQAKGWARFFRLFAVHAGLLAFTGDGSGCLVVLTAGLPCSLRPQKDVLAVFRQCVTRIKLSVAGEASRRPEAKQGRNPVDAFAVQGIARRALATRASEIRRQHISFSLRARSHRSRQHLRLSSRISNSREIAAGIHVMAEVMQEKRARRSQTRK